MLNSDMLNVSSREAGLERIQRERARRNLIPYAEYVSPWYRPARHHHLIAEVLEQVELYIKTRGTQGIGRALFFMPPRHGKTELVSRKFPSWLLGRQPDLNIILTSYGADLAKTSSRKVRDDVTGRKFAAVFGDRSALDVPVEIADDSRSAAAWDLASPHRGGVVAAGVGGGITGRGAHLLVVDDPFKNREEAESEAHRAQVMEWWSSTAYTRLEDGGAVVGMLTRWHPDDWAGQLIQKMASDPLADQYHVLSLPAICEEVSGGEVSGVKSKREWMMEGVWVNEEDPLDRETGQALWPEKYDVEALRRIEANIGPHDWAALYQQRPYLKSGAMFKREWFVVVDDLPSNIVSRVRYWDKAGTAGGGAFTAGVLLAMTEDKHVIVEHVHRGQWSGWQREQEMVKMAQLDKERPGPRAVIWHEQEPGSGGKDSAEATNRNLALAGFNAHFETVSGAKEVRAEPWATALEGGMGRLLRGPWNAAYINEHVSFPKGTYKDQVDGSSGGFSKLRKKRESNIR